MSATVLIADDDFPSRTLLEERLLEEGYRVLAAADGREAIELAQNIAPDLVLLDVMMPHVDGYGVCEALRADPRLGDVPIILVTALDDRASKLRGLEAGADDFISKPYDSAELKARVRTITRLNRYRRRLAERTKFEWAVDRSDDGYVLLDDGGHIVYANRAACGFFGRPAEDLHIVGESFLRLADTIYRRHPEEAWLNWPQPSEATYYLVRPEAPGSPAMWLSIEVLELPGAADDVDEGRRLARLRDVTSQMHLQRSMWEFNALISHKLRTPLTVILGGLDMLGKDVTHMKREEIVEILDFASSSAQRLKGELLDILDFLDAPTLVDEGEGMAVSDLADLSRRVAEDLKIEQFELRSELDFAAERQIRLSPTACELILREVLANCRKFHPENRPRVEMVLDIPDGELGHLRVLVLDDGVAIPPEDLGKVWTPYFQSEKGFSGNVAGMGLGLAKVAALLWGVGGRGRIFNRPGASDGGVAVELVFPY